MEDKEKKMRLDSTDLISELRIENESLKSKLEEKDRQIERLESFIQEQKN